MKTLPPSSRYRCLRILKPTFAWSVEVGKPVPLTDETPNPNCSICSGPLAPRKSKAAESRELSETVNV